jgi:hypothetical protein
MSRTKVKESVEFANKAFESLESQQTYIKELEDKVKHLESLLKSSNIPTIESNSPSNSPLSRKSHEEEIIQVEFRRLHHKVVGLNEPLDPRDLKKFEILVKALVALKSGQIKEDKSKKSKEKETPVEDLLRIVMLDGENNGQPE